MKSVLPINKTIIIKSSGKSMFPLISSGDEVLINTNSLFFKKLRIGNIIAFKNGFSVMVHRIVKKINTTNANTLFVTKGDFNSKNDRNYVSNKNYLGVVTSVSNSSYVFNLMSNKAIILNYYLLVFSLLFKVSFFRNFLNKIAYNHTFHGIFIFLFSERNRKSFNARKNRNAEFMQYLLLNFKKNNFNKDCGWDFFNNFIEEEGIILEMRRNKMGFFFNHFNSCSSCKKYFSKSTRDLFFNEIKNSFARITFLDEVKNTLEPILIKNRVKFLKLKKSTSLSNSYDIDYLVDARDFKLFSVLLMINNFYIEDIPPQEVSFKHKKYFVEVDAHFYTSIPRSNIFNLRKTKKLTREIIQSSRNGKIDREHMLLSTVVRFWTNDFHRGLRKLYEIGIAFGDSKVDWQKYDKLSKKYGFFEESLLTISIVEKVFNKNIIPNIATLESNQRYKLLSKYFSIKKLSTFNESEFWWDENNLQTRRHLLELHLLRLALNDSFISILSKPRVLWLFLICFF